jgi:hypothetical protein
VIVRSTCTGNLWTIIRKSGVYTSPKGDVMLDHPYNTDSVLVHRQPGQSASGSTAGPPLAGSARVGMCVRP